MFETKKYDLESEKQAFLEAEQDYFMRPILKGAPERSEMSQRALDGMDRIISPNPLDR